VTIPLDIPMPPAIARLERDRRGYPVSYITRRRAVPRLRASAGVNRSQIVAALVRRGSRYGEAGHGSTIAKARSMRRCVNCKQLDLERLLSTRGPNFPTSRLEGAPQERVMVIFAVKEGSNGRCDLLRRARVQEGRG
jgi:hypothetical protein